MILSIKIDAEERFLERIFFEGRTKVIDDLLRLIQSNFFAERHQRIDDFGFINAHGERSRAAFPPLNFMLSDRGCCPTERPLGMGESQSAGWSAEAVCRCGTNEGE